ncbi:MAG: Clp protease ClpP [Alphaproteobacteria bacterium]|nr:Clp protease ClpP [Alphaproteobacteria bacterium]
MAKEKMQRRNHLPMLSMAGTVVMNKLNIGDAKSQIAALADFGHLADRFANKSKDIGLNVKNIGDEAHIYIDDDISAFYGITAKMVTNAFEKAHNKDIVLHINCAGGDVMQARAMVSTIVAYEGKVTAMIDGLCASAATFIACACASVAMNDGGLFMVHNASGLCWGDHVDMNKQADILLKITNTIAADYAAKTGEDKEAMLALMDAETFMNADEALEAGFIDEIIETRHDKTAEPKNAAKLPIAENVADNMVEPVEPEPNYEQLRIKAQARALELSADA